MKKSYKPGTMIYPLPAVLVSCGGTDGRKNMLTIAWTGTICSDPPMVYISVRPERYSYDLIKETGEFVINLTNKELSEVTDEAGVRSGRDMDKFEYFGLTPEKGELVYAPMIMEAPVSIECKVKDVIPLGTHDMFIANVISVFADEAYMDEDGKFDLRDTDPLCYCHGEYYTLGKKLGKFGYTVRKKK